MDYLRWFPSALTPLPPAVANFHMPIEAVRSMGNQEPLEFIQDADCGHFAVNCTGYPYGVNLVVRVAEIRSR